MSNPLPLMESSQEPEEADLLTPEPVVPPTPSRQRFRSLRLFMKNRKAIFGVVVLLIFVAGALAGPHLTDYGPKDFAGRPNVAPSGDHYFGTDGQGRDVFAQMVWGARETLRNGFLVGIITTAVGAVVGLTAGYFRGIIDELLSLVMNVFLIIPSLPLLVVLAAFLADGFWILPDSMIVVLVLSITGWAWPARVMRSQMLSLREKDFVSAAVVSGESRTRIIFSEIFPNMLNIVVTAFLGGTVYAIGAEAGLEFLGLGNISKTTWGTILYWAQNNSALLLGAWWAFVPAGLAIALVAVALVMMNYAMDEISNPRLQAQREATTALKNAVVKGGRATPVLKHANAN